jgi:hypothetical protein
MYGRSREEVRRLLAEALAARESGTLTHARGMTFGSFMDIWLAEVAKPSVRPWTFKGYEVHVRLHLKPTLGRLPLDRLEPAHVQRLRSTKRFDGATSRVIRQQWSTGRESNPTRYSRSAPWRLGSFLKPRGVIGFAPCTR